MEERWCDIPGYEGHYQVSTWGNVRSVERTCSVGSGKTRAVDARQLRKLVHYKGYHYVFLYRGGKSTQTKRFVHRLVAETYLPNGEAKPFVNHIDRNKQNNGIENLEWATVSENTLHYYATERVRMAQVMARPEPVLVAGDLPW